MKYLKNVSTLKYNLKECIGCGMCVEVCPHDVFLMKGNRADLIDVDACMECGGCKRNCPSGAIEVTEGVGCAYAIVMGKLKGTEPNCGCSGDTQSGCC